MRYILPEEKRDGAKDIWGEIESLLGVHIKKFIKHYTLHMYGYSKNESDYNLIHRNNGAKETTGLLSDLRIKAEYYAKFIAPRLDGDNGNCSETEFLVFSFFKKKRQEQMRPVLLSLIHHHVKGDIGNESYNQVLMFIYNFYICYNIIGEENSNKLSHSVYKYAMKIENEFSMELVQEFTEELRKKLPSKETFLSIFRTVGWSHHGGFFSGEKNKDRSQTVLEVFERYLTGGCSENLTIEHVLLDADSPDNGEIGNLLPLEDSLNEKCGGLNWKDKLDIYSESSFKTTRNFAKRYKNQDFIIRARTDVLGKQLYDDVLAFRL